MTRRRLIALVVLILWGALCLLLSKGEVGDYSGHQAELTVLLLLAPILLLPILLLATLVRYRRKRMVRLLLGVILLGGFVGAAVWGVRHYKYKASRARLRVQLEAMDASEYYNYRLGYLRRRQPNFEQAPMFSVKKDAVDVRILPAFIPAQQFTLICISEDGLSTTGGLPMKRELSHVEVRVTDVTTNTTLLSWEEHTLADLGRDEDWEAQNIVLKLSLSARPPHLKLLNEDDVFQKHMNYLDALRKRTKKDCNVPTMAQFQQQYMKYPKMFFCCYLTSFNQKPPTEISALAMVPALGRFSIIDTSATVIESNDPGELQVAFASGSTFSGTEICEAAGLPRSTGNDDNSTDTEVGLSNVITSHLDLKHRRVRHVTSEVTARQLQPETSQEPFRAQYDLHLYHPPSREMLELLK